MGQIYKADDNGESYYWVNLPITEYNQFVSVLFMKSRFEVVEDSNV